MKKRTNFDTHTHTNTQSHTHTQTHTHRHTHTHTYTHTQTQKERTRAHTRTNTRAHTHTRTHAHTHTFAHVESIQVFAQLSSFWRDLYPQFSIDSKFFKPTPFLIHEPKSLTSTIERGLLRLPQYATP